MDVLYFILFFLALAGIYYLINRWETGDKDNYKQKAARLLMTSDPDPKEVKNTIKFLRLYAGRIKKDKEAIKLMSDLQNKHGHLL